MEEFLFGRIGLGGFLLVVAVGVLVWLGIGMYRQQPTPEEQARQAKQEIRRIHRKAREDMMRAYMQRSGAHGNVTVGGARVTKDDVIEGEVVEPKSRGWRF